MSLSREMVERRKRWVEALRSGKFQQGQGKLCSMDKYCCLGVACEVFAEELGLTVEEVYVYGTTKRLKIYSGSSGFCPEAIAEHLNIRRQTGKAIGLCTPTLITFNDYAGLTFEQIADYIETETEKELKGE